MNTDKIYAESIAKEYAPQNTSRIAALKKLDRKAKLPAEIFTYTWSVIFSLISFMQKNPEKRKKEVCI